MRIQELDHLFPIKLNHCFNPSVIGLDYPNLYLVCFRQVSKTSDAQHVWEHWLKGNKMDIKKSKLPITSSGELINESNPTLKNGEQILLYKITERDLPLKLGYNDRTGFLIIYIDPITQVWTPLLKTLNSYSNNMIDTRLQKDYHNNIHLTYNISGRNSNADKIEKMVTRTVKFDIERSILIFGKEKNMLEDIEYNLVEKNCIYDFRKSKKMILYEIRSNFSVIKDEKLIKHENPFFDKMLSIYPSNSFFMSLSTPVLDFGKDKKLGLGHFKILWKNIPENSNLGQFIKMFMNKINYGLIYFMYFFEYDAKTLELTKISHAFIPTNDKNMHLPYNLVFPTGFIQKNNSEYFILYGEGDDRCKNLIMTKDEIISMLHPIQTMNGKNYLFMLLQDKLS